MAWTAWSQVGFATVAGTTTFPNQIRNQFRGPGFFDSDFTINKNFKLTERMAFGIGANFYNIFNHPNFASPVDTYAPGNFGQVFTTTAPPTGPYGAFFTGSAFGTHHPVPGQAGVLTSVPLKLLLFGGPQGPPFFGFSRLLKPSIGGMVRVVAAL